MAGRVLTQLLKGTDWGELDVLVLDLPPGTGDVQLTLCQDVELSGAVCVTTPSELAAVDARKGVAMFRKLGVPTLAANDENSDKDKDGVGPSLFGLTSSSVFRLPISTLANDANDAGAPLCLTRPAGAAAELDAFAGLAS